jgi:hypothetical protein
MDFPFAAVEIVFQTNHPTALKQKTGRENFTIQPIFQVFANRYFLSETPFSGREKDLIPNILWLQENFQKKLRMGYANDIPK